jgi:hypothetical protein
MRKQRPGKRAPQEIDILLLAVEAGGGFKFRQFFKLSNQDMPAFIAGCEAGLRQMASSLAVAETMLKEPAPSVHPRRDEYQRRRAEATRAG